MSKKKRMGYIISVDGNTDFEYNVDDEILVFETLTQIEEYAKVNKIDKNKLNVYSVELEDEHEICFTRLRWIRLQSFICGYQFWGCVGSSKDIRRTNSISHRKSP